MQDRTGPYVDEPGFRVQRFQQCRGRQPHRFWAGIRIEIENLEAKRAPTRDEWLNGQ